MNDNIQDKFDGKMVYGLLADLNFGLNYSQNGQEYL